MTVSRLFTEGHQIFEGSFVDNFATTEGPFLDIATTHRPTEGQITEGQRSDTTEGQITEGLESTFLLNDPSTTPITPSFNISDLPKPENYLCLGNDFVRLLWITGEALVIHGEIQSLAFYALLEWF